MVLYTELPVYKDTYQLILRVFEVTKDFSKEYKYTLGQDMKRDALRLMRTFIGPTYVFFSIKLLRDSDDLPTISVDNVVCRAVTSIEVLSNNYFNARGLFEHIICVGSIVNNL